MLSRNYGTFSAVELGSVRPLFSSLLDVLPLYNAARESFSGFVGLIAVFLVYLGGDSNEFVCPAFLRKPTRGMEDICLHVSCLRASGPPLFPFLLLF